MTPGQVCRVKVRPRKHPSGLVTYQLDLGEVNGKRVQRSYKKKAAANKALKAAKKAQARHGSMASELTGAAMAEIVLARDRLRAAGWTLTEAVEFALKHGGRMAETITVPELVKRYIDTKDDCSVRYRRQLKVSLGSLAERFATRKAHELVKADIEAWLKASGWKAKTRNNYVGDVRACFAWGKGYVRINPAAEIPKLGLGDEEIGTLTVPRCEVLLRGALQRPEMMGFVVLGMFGGLRPAEIQRLDWSAVNFKERTVVVAGSQAKTRRRRVVDLTENAVAWLHAAGCEKLKGEICGKWWDARWRMFRRSLGWDVGSEEKGIVEAKVKPVHGEWPHNALRHTYASMHYAMHQDEAKLQAQMGHESAAMLHRHYKALVTAVEAKKFWALKPGS